MGMYTSFKLVAVIDEPYRDLFFNLLETDTSCNLCNGCKEDNQCNLKRYINYLYFGGGFFDVDKEYSKETGIFVCGTRLKTYGHIYECEGNEVQFCIKNIILPFGKIIEYFDHNDDMCYDCSCDPECIENSGYFFENKRSHYINKYKDIIENLQTKDINLNDKMKELLKKDIHKVLDRYSSYNFNFSQLEKSLENL